MTSAQTLEELLTPADVAKRLGVSPVTVRSWVAKGWLKSRITPGGHRRFLWHDIERLLAARKISVSPGEHQRRMLIIDDDPLFRSYLIETLLILLPTALIKEASGGFLAGMTIAGFNPDLVLLDYAMPGMNGIEVCQLIKSNPLLAATRIVAMTGSTDPATHAALMNAGADDVLHKPISLRRITAVLEQFALLQQRRE